MYTRLTLPTILSLAALLLSVPQALAAGPESLQISPAIFEDKVDPGKSYDYTLKVTNQSEAEKTFYLRVRDIAGINEGGRPEFADEGEPTPFNLSTWIAVTDEAIVIPPGETHSVRFSIAVPADASPGSHFGGIFVESEPPRLRTSGAAVGVSVGSLINLQISGDLVEDARLRSFSTSQLVYDALPVALEVRLENLGNTLLRPAGFVSIVNMFGKEVANVRLNENAAGAFPSDERTFALTWEDEEVFAFGRYQAVLSLVYGNEVRKTLTASTSFWVLPMKPIAITLGTILALVLALYFGVRSYIRKKLREFGVTDGSSRRGRQEEARLARTMFITVSLVVFCVVFLGVLFILFA